MNLHDLTREELIDNFVEIKIDGSDGFLKIRETLTRMGVANKKTKTIYQSCHILHKKINDESKYFIVHFKELFALDGREVFMGEDDFARRNTIANIFADWNMATLVDQSKSKEPVLGQSKELHKNMLTIIPFKEKSQWNCQAKYKMGKK
jgi:hypothetical protein